MTDADPQRAARVADELAVRAVATPEALVDAVDALMIATSTPSHAPLLELAAASAVAAFCEKPVALDLATLDRVREAVDRAGIIVQVGFQRRFDAGYETARAAVAAGAVGKILVMRAATHDPIPPPAEYIAASGGIFCDLHIHDFDAIRFVSGEEVTEVYADGAGLDAPWVGELERSLSALTTEPRSCTIDQAPTTFTGTIALMLEANPNPQIAKGEDFAASAEKIGIGYDALLQRIVNLGGRWQPESAA